MKKILCATILTVGMCQTSDGMHAVSYHLFSGSPALPTVDLTPTTKTKLYSELSECNQRFQSAPCTQLGKVAVSLTDDYKSVFVAENKDALAEILVQEKAVFDNIEALPGATDAIIQLGKGLPDAALCLKSMYETAGIYNVAILWALVAYKLGYKQAKADASRLFLIIGK